MLEHVCRIISLLVCTVQGEEFVLTGPPSARPCSHKRRLEQAAALHGVQMSVAKPQGSISQGSGSGASGRTVARHLQRAAALHRGLRAGEEAHQRAPLLQREPLGGEDVGARGGHGRRPAPVPQPAAG